MNIVTTISATRMISTNEVVTFTEMLDNTEWVRSVEDTVLFPVPLRTCVSGLTATGDLLHILSSLKLPPKN